MAKRASTSSAAAKKKSELARLSLADFTKQLRELSAQGTARPGFDLIRELSTRKISNPLLLATPQTLRARRLVEWFLESCSLTRNTQAVQNYFGSQFTTQHQIETFLRELRSPSLFAPNQVIILYGWEHLKANLAKTFAPQIAETQLSAFCIIVNSDPDQKPDTAFTHFTAGTAIAIEDLTERETQRWIEREVDKMGEKQKIEPQAVSLLHSLYGSDVTSLAQAVERLSLVTPRSETISASLVKQLCEGNAHGTTFDLLSDIARRRLLEAMENVTTLRHLGFHPLQLSSFLGRCFRILLYMRAGERERKLSGDFSNYWYRKQLERFVSLFTVTDLQHCLAILGQLDSNLKGSPLPEQLTVEEAVRKMALRRPAGSALPLQ